MKKQELEQILKTYAEMNHLDTSNFNFIVQFTKHPTYINLAADAEITFEFFASRIKLIKNDSYLFSDVLDIWQILNNHLLQNNDQLNKRQQQISADTLEKIQQLLPIFLKQGVSKAHTMELFKNAKDSLNRTTLELLANYPIYIKHVIYGHQIRYLRELLSDYIIDFESIQILLWQVVIDHLPTIVLPNSIVVLAVENQYWFNITGKSLPSTEVAKAFLNEGIKLKRDPLSSSNEVKDKFSQAISFDPKLKDAYNQRYLINQAQCSYELAIADLMQLKNFEPDNENLYLQLGQLYKSQKKFELALENFNAAIKLNPRKPFGYYERGLIYMKIGTVNLAIVDFTEAIKLKPDFAEAYNFRAELYERQNFLELAQKDFLAASKYNSNNTNASISYRRISSKLKEIETSQALPKNRNFWKPEDEAKLYLGKRKEREEISQEQSEQSEKKFRHS